MGTVWTLATATLGEAIRRKILIIFLVVGIALIGLFFAFAQFNAYEQLDIIKSTGLGVISIAGLFISVILGINLIPNEIDKRTIYTILSKPVARWQFIAGKFIGALLTVFLNIAAMGVIFLVGVWWKMQAPEFSIIDGVVMIFFQMMLVNAVALMFSVFVTPFVNFFLTFATYIIGSMSSVTESLAMPNPKQSILVTYFFQAVHFLVPNFGNFNIQNPIIHPDIEIVNMGGYMTQNIILALIEVLIMMLIAVIVFDRREV